MSGENTGSIGKAKRGGKLCSLLLMSLLLLSLDGLQFKQNENPGPGSYFNIHGNQNYQSQKMLESISEDANINR